LDGQKNKSQAHAHIDFFNSSQINTREKDFLNNEEASKNINIYLKSNNN
jgi:hypothetical protein